VIDAGGSGPSKQEMPSVSLLPRGVHPILYALFGPDGELDRDAMRRQVEVCIGQGAVGIATLGLATEVRHLDVEQRQRIIEWNAEDVAGRVPLGVTIFGETPEDQIERVRHAAAVGADWVILQPPASATDDAALADGFSRVLDLSPLPAALQNMPQFLGVGLSVDAITTLAGRYPRLVAVKQEVSALETAALVDRVGVTVQVLSGRGGVELVDCMLAGVDGHIPAPEYADYLVELWGLMSRCREAEARDLYARVLPLATFVLQSLDILTCYGKLLFCLRNDLPFHPRPGALQPNAFGLKLLGAHAERLGIETRGWEPRLETILSRNS
jgi:4-hydroxy-tetrahydrodipicolinate synthase